MKRIKTLLIFSLVIALSFSLFGCKLLPWGDSAVEETSTITSLPGWLTLAHRAEAAEEPEVDGEEEEAAAEVEETAVAPAQTATTQPAATQPATTQPAPAASSEPAWKQPGTLDYIMKMNLDDAVNEYKRLKAMSPDTIKDYGEDAHKKRLSTLATNIPKAAASIGVNLQSEYGITITTSSSSAGAIWDTMGSPSGLGGE
jgi:hypothetical protein